MVFRISNKKQGSSSISRSTLTTSSPEIEVVRGLSSRGRSLTRSKQQGSTSSRRNAVHNSPEKIVVVARGRGRSRTNEPKGARTTATTTTTSTSADPKEKAITIVRAGRVPSTLKHTTAINRRERSSSRRQRGRRNLRQRQRSKSATKKKSPTKLRREQSQSQSQPNDQQQQADQIQPKKKQNIKRKPPRTTTTGQLSTQRSSSIGTRDRSLSVGPRDRSLSNGPRDRSSSLRRRRERSSSLRRQRRQRSTSRSRSRSRSQIRKEQEQQKKELWHQQREQLEKDLRQAEEELQQREEIEIIRWRDGNGHVGGVGGVMDARDRSLTGIGGGIGPHHIVSCESASSLSTLSHTIAKHREDTNVGCYNNTMLYDANNESLIRLVGADGIGGTAGGAVCGVGGGPPGWFTSRIFSNPAPPHQQSPPSTASPTSSSPRQRHGDSRSIVVVELQPERHNNDAVVKEEVIELGHHAKQDEVRQPQHETQRDLRASSRRRSNGRIRQQPQLEEAEVFEHDAIELVALKRKGGYKVGLVVRTNNNTDGDSSNAKTAKKKNTSTTTTKTKVGGPAGAAAGAASKKKTSIFGFVGSRPSGIQKRRKQTIVDLLSTYPNLKLDAVSSFP